MGTQINQLTEVLTGSSGQQIPIFDPGNGGARKMSLNTLLTWILTQAPTIPGKAEPDTQYAGPAATGFNVQINDSDRDVHLILTPLAPYASGAITLPLRANCRDKQEIIVNCTQAVTAFTVNGNGEIGRAHV